MRVTLLAEEFIQRNLPVGRRRHVHGHEGEPAPRIKRTLVEFGASQRVHILRRDGAGGEDRKQGRIQAHSKLSYEFQRLRGSKEEEPLTAGASKNDAFF
jgi:hypothetical protein